MCRYTTDRYYQGDLVAFGKDLVLNLSNDPVSAIEDIMVPFWGPVAVEAWCWVGAFGVFQAALQLLIPGSVFKGPVTPKGNVPVYKVGVLAPVACNHCTPSVKPPLRKPVRHTAPWPLQGKKALLIDSCLQANGPQCYALSLVVFFLGARCVLQSLHLVEELFMHYSHYIVWLHTLQ